MLHFAVFKNCFSICNDSGFIIFRILLVMVDNESLFFFSSIPSVTYDASFRPDEDLKGRNKEVKDLRKKSSANDKHLLGASMAQEPGLSPV